MRAPLLCLLLAGCSSVKSPVAQIKSAMGTQLDQKGDAAAPASVTTSMATTRIPQIAGGRITIDIPKLSREGQSQPISAPQAHASTPIEVMTATEYIEAPRAFTPPPPASEEDKAEARARTWFWVGLVAGVAAAIFGLVRSWNFVMYGGASIAGACACAIFVQRHPLIFALIGVGVAVAVLGPYFWHTHLKHIPDDPSGGNQTKSS